jgi:hypothetical protein
MSNLTRNLSNRAVHYILTAVAFAREIGALMHPIPSGTKAIVARRINLHEQSIQKDCRANCARALYNFALPKSAKTERTYKDLDGTSTLRPSR